MLFKNRGKAIAHTNKNTATNANAKDTPIPDIHRRTNKTRTKKAKNRSRNYRTCKYLN